VRAIKNFLEEGHRVKVSVFFRGREMSFLSKGEDVLNRVIAECDGIGKNEGSPRMEGRYMRILLTPTGPAKPKKPQTPAQKEKSTQASASVDSPEDDEK
jgi:translation initiation factor IF-3